MPSSDDIALIGWSISPMVRNTDKTEAQMLLEVITGAVERRRDHPPRGRLHLRGQLRLRGRPGVLVRAEHRRHRRVAAEARLARRDGRRVGAVRGVAPAAARRHRRRGGDGVGSVVDRRPGAHLPDGDGPVLPRAARHRRGVVRRAAGPRAASTRARSPSGRWPRSRPAARRDAKGEPARAGDRRLRRRRRCSPRTTCGRRCAGTTSRRSPTARARSSSPAPTRPGSCASDPVWITGFAHYSELHYPGMRDLTSSPSTTLAAKAAGLDEAPVDVAELQAAFTHEEPLLVEALGLGADVPVNPSGGPLAANPIMATGLVRVAEAADADPRPRQAPHARALDVGSVPAAEPGLHPRGGIQVSHQPCAIVGIGQTHHKKAPSRRVATAASPGRRRSARSTTPT